MDLSAFLSDQGAAFGVAGGVSWRAALVSMLLAYVLCQAVATTYAATYRGLSYSRSMTQALVVAGIVAATLMLSMGNSVARGIGIVGTLALIRFRTNLRDPLDMIFVFASFGAGIASGTGSWATAIAGTAVFIVVVGVMRLSAFGSHRLYDGIVRLRLPVQSNADVALQKTLRGVCRHFALVTLREVRQGEHLEYAYHVALRDRDDEQKLVTELSAITGATGVALSMQEATVEL